MPESDWLPLDPEDHAAQLAAVMRLAHGPPRAQRILDLGAGTGRLATPLAQRGHDVCAIDLLPEALERDRNLFGRHADGGEGSGQENTDDEGVMVSAKICGLTTPETLQPLDEHFRLCREPLPGS